MINQRNENEGRAAERIAKDKASQDESQNLYLSLLVAERGTPWVEVEPPIRPSR
jgi:hypothetical protein